MRLAAACVLMACAVSAQVARQANERYQTESGRAGIASGLAGADRDERQKPRELIQMLGIAPGMTVADVGTGVGYMLPFLSSAAGSGGRVIAEDVFPDFLSRARKNAGDHKLGNVEFVQGTERDTRLPEGAADVVLVLDAYHHFDYPGAVLASIAKALKPGGRLAVVEYKKGANGLPPGHIRLDEDDAVREIESYGFRAVERREFSSNNQWIGVFAKK